MQSWLISHRNRMTVNHCFGENCWDFEWSAELPYVKWFTICQEVLNISQIAKAFHSNSPILILAILLKYFPLFFEPLFQRCHSSQIDGVLKFDDSMTDLHRIWPMTINCQCKWLAFSDGSRNILKLFCLARIRMNPLSGKISNKDSISMIVSGFTSFTDITSPNFSARSTAPRVRFFCKELL